MATEMHDLTETAAAREPRDDVEMQAGQSSSSGGDDDDDEGGGGGGGGEGGRGESVNKKETVVLRLGEGKLTGPMRFITCYATVFTFVVMTGGIVWLLLISPPFNVTPETLPGPSGGRATPATLLTTVFPSETETPEFSPDFNQA